MKCISCKKEAEAVFRTEPLGSENAGWMCRPCIIQHHDVSLIDPETQELVDAFTAKPAAVPPDSYRIGETVEYQGCHAEKFRVVDFRTLDETYEITELELFGDWSGIGAGLGRSWVPAVKVIKI